MDQFQFELMLTRLNVRLATALNELAGRQVTPYKSANLDDKRTIWLLESYQNWLDMFEFATIMADEYEEAYECQPQIRPVLDKLKPVAKKYRKKFPSQESTDFVYPEAESTEEKES